MLQLIQPFPPGAGKAGWEVFTSFPGVNPGNITPSATTSASPGSYGFVVSGLTGTGNQLEVETVDATGLNNTVIIPISNGQVFVTPAPAFDSGSPIVSVVFWIFNGSDITNTLTISNFTLNNVPIPFDTTHFDNNDGSALFSWCNQF